ncbi:hypothetical protein IOD14_21745 [Streptomyces sp. A2-16]|uniref:hypothetical protein n=1 Tax=Streptomyces sp. A2-16 TaxID=2781734 RepID=UPI001BB03F71|nr:hypothetical protein [Streptomyces sp. A2-16]QUC63791.1 hypothetical protein IOD14_21745 [Streptomyces sp. A2-16]
MPPPRPRAGCGAASAPGRRGGLWGPDARDPLDVCRPLGVEVHRPDHASLDGWTPPARVAYRNLHGLRRPDHAEAAG